MLFFPRKDSESKTPLEFVTELAKSYRQIAFLERVLDRQRGPARVGHAGVPKKKQGPLNQRIVIVSREEAALLVPGVKFDSTGTVGSFEWGADYVEVKIAENTFDYKKLRNLVNSPELAKGDW